MVRYSLLPFWYTVFYQSYSTGQPIMRAMFSEFPNDEATFTMDDQWLVGRSLLVKPVTENGVTQAQVYFPEPTAGWYDLHTYKPMKFASDVGSVVSVPAPLSMIPVFIRGGSIIPRKMRLRRSSSLMFYDPITLIVAPAADSGSAEGSMYMDDERTLDHEDTSLFVYRLFSFTQNEKATGSVLTNMPVPGSSWMVGGIEKDSGNMVAPNKVERIIVLGQHRLGSPKKVILQNLFPNGRGKWTESADVVVEFFYDSESGTITLKKPNVLVTAEWKIMFEY
jgi:alpha 1,3-glucosidase